MDTAAWVDTLTKSFGALGLLIAAVGLVLKWLIPRYEARTQQVIDAYKAQLEDAKNQIQEATKERKELTARFLETMETCIKKSNDILQELVTRIEALEKSEYQQKR
jgi:uncharacterized membrane-anchored protein YhcB (DUF1043 family)